jgi:NAD(P)-dependent dehydrogenase (short-subunit alcohol dehydrogenase family)
MDLGLKGKTALITGASQGIGEATAESFAREGCNVRIAARRKEELDAIATRLAKSYGVKTQTFAIDLSKSGELDKLAEANRDIDILVNNAGAIPFGPMTAIDEATWRAAWDLKVFGYINLTRRIYAQMKERGGGVIVNDCGAAGERFNPDYLAGAMGNAALITMSRALGSRSLQDKIRVLCVNPGPVKTPRLITQARRRALAAHGSEDRWEEMVGDRHIADPSEVADLIVFLASPRCPSVTGSAHNIDGGNAALTH